MYEYEWVALNALHFTAAAVDRNDHLDDDIDVNNINFDKQAGESRCYFYAKEDRGQHKQTQRTKKKTKEYTLESYSKQKTNTKTNFFSPIVFFLFLAKTR